MRAAERVGIIGLSVALGLCLVSLSAFGVTVHTVNEGAFQGEIRAGLPGTLALSVEGSIVRIDRAQIARVTFADDGVTVVTVGEETYRGQLNTELPETLRLATRSATVEIPYADVAAITFERPQSLLAQFTVPLQFGIGLTKRSIPLVGLQDGASPIPDGLGTLTPTVTWEIPISREETILSSGPYDVPLEETRTAVRLTAGLNLQDVRVDASRVDLSVWQLAVDYLHYFGHQAFGRPIAIGIFVGEQRNFALVQLNPYVSTGLGLAIGAAGPPIGRSFATVEGHLGGGLRVSVNVRNVSIQGGAQFRFLPGPLAHGHGLHGDLSFRAGLVFSF